MFSYAIQAYIQSFNAFVGWIKRLIRGLYFAKLTKIYGLEGGSLEFLVYLQADIVKVICF